MAKYEDQVARMNFLMEYKTPEKKTFSNIEYHANGADGKVYGILKEGTKYYIKTTEKGKENISESYEYIGGFTNRRENEFTDYNKATKQLEFKLMSLNEAYGKHEKTSTVDVNRSEKVFATLTEEARKEINRMNQIFENSCSIGMNCICDPESKGKSTGDNTVKNNEPFTEKTEATLDKDPKFNGTVDNATENKEVKDVEEDLKSDKNKTANSGSEKDYKATHDDIDGEGVADKNPKGGKVVKVNEGIDGVDGEDVETTANDINANDFEGNEDEGLVDNTELGGGAETEPESELTADEFENDAEPTEVGNDVAGISGEEADDFDTLLEEFEKNFVEDTEEPEVKPETATNENKEAEAAKDGGENILKGDNGEKKLPVQTCDKLNEAIVAITKDVYRKLTESKKPKTKHVTLEEAVAKIVKEEVTKLDAWGKHPRFRKAPMTTPSNKEVLAGTAGKDWNDESAKGEKPYGEKIGDGKPFEELVSNLTDKVIAQIKESIKSK